MATYNGALYVKEQIDSILPQLTDDDELLVADDQSVDDTLDILLSYGSKLTVVATTKVGGDWSEPLGSHVHSESPGLS